MRVFSVLAIGISLVSSPYSVAETFCRVVELSGAQVLDRNIEMTLDVKILTFELFPDYIGTISWPQNTKEMTIAFGKMNRGLVSESKARIVAPGDYLHGVVHLDADAQIKVNCAQTR